jgi:hypothetical protein
MTIPARERECGEQPDGEERYEAGDVGAEADDERPGREGEGQDAVGQHEPVAAIGELAGQEPVPGDDPG